jgi:hypothetical protein
MKSLLSACFLMFHIFVIVCPRSSILLDVIQIRCSVDVFQHYFNNPLLLRFEYVEFRVLAFKFNHNIYICDVAFAWSLIYSFMIFISYSPFAIFFSVNKN